MQVPRAICRCTMIWGPGPVLQIYIYPPASVPFIDNMPSSCACDVHTHLACVPCVCACVCVCVCVLHVCAVQCRTEMSPIMTTDWVPGLEGILIASSLTLLLSRVFTHCRDFTAIKSTPCRVYSRLCAQAGCSINVFCVYYRALPRTIDGAPPGPGATLANIYIYIHTCTPPEITYCTIIGPAALGNKYILQTF